ncbi:tRNA lysidine(34) synthetase TilS [Ekhidna sp. To15]|uniref:tRNA lysidine(34) synthetase TilS n=1 Tax=Ekhidna sp. To15 TaxID=3395267 RepID=UPI003F527C6C
MQSLQKQFHDFILTNDLVKKGEKVLLAVSGGLDSMVMAHLFLKEKIPIAIAHCNYGLRGDESDGDEAFVMDWADKQDISCHAKAIEITGSVQLEARNARYEWFTELALEHNYDKVATAHHLSDSLETILINLTRGTGIKGMSGISVKNENVIRPLLFADKQRLHDFAMQQDLEWREDSSNSKTDYDRNLIRHDVVPELLKLNPSLFKTFGLTTERLSYASEIVDMRTEEIRKTFLAKRSNGFQLDLSWLSNSSDELVLAELLTPFGVNYTTAKEIYDAFGKSGRSFPVHDWLITMDRSTLFIDKDESKKVEVWIDSPGEYEIGNEKMLVEQVGKEDVVFGASHIAYFDIRKLKFPLLVRSWHKGDRFQPFGMTGEKKISDYLIDEKVPLAIKKEVLVLECKDHIAWLIDMRVSDAFKVTDDSAQIIKITFLKPKA